MARPQCSRQRAGIAAIGYHRAVDGALPGRLRRILRLIGWNALILLIGVVLAAGGAEIWLRLTAPRLSGPFTENVLPVRLVPGVGIVRPPHTEVRFTNADEFWTTARTNGLGFLDREPPSPERAAASCHVTLIGDSFVEAREVPIAAKARTRLEELAAREAPALDVTASAFGHNGSAQINQLAFYDAWARHLSPDVVALVFIPNDFPGNSLALMSWEWGFHPDHPPWLYARPGPDGEFEFVPPASSLEELRAKSLARLLGEPVILPLWDEHPTGVEAALRTRSYLFDWLWRTLDDRQVRRRAALRARAEWLSRHHFPTFMDGWSASRWQRDLLLEETPPPVVREALDATRFALEQFHERAERDGAALVILANHEMGGEGDPLLGHLHEVVTAAGGKIPVISQYDHIIAAGGAIADAHYPRDRHWNAAGHRWAAEAILDWLKRNPEACD